MLVFPDLMVFDNFKLFGAFTTILTFAFFDLTNLKKISKIHKQFQINYQFRPITYLLRDYSKYWRKNDSKK